LFIGLFLEFSRLGIDFGGGGGRHGFHHVGDAFEMLVILDFEGDVGVVGGILFLFGFLKNC
jgi:hypothetical protein